MLGAPPNLFPRIGSCRRERRSLRSVFLNSLHACSCPERRACASNRLNDPPLSLQPSLLLPLPPPHPSSPLTHTHTPPPHTHLHPQSTHPTQPQQNPNPNHTTPPPPEKPSSTLTGSVVGECSGDDWSLVSFRSVRQTGGGNGRPARHDGSRCDANCEGNLCQFLVSQLTPGNRVARVTKTRCQGCEVLGQLEAGAAFTERSSSPRSEMSQESSDPVFFSRDPRCRCRVVHPPRRTSRVPNVPLKLCSEAGPPSRISRKAAQAGAGTESFSVGCRVDFFPALEGADSSGVDYRVALCALVVPPWGASVCVCLVCGVALLGGVCVRCVRGCGRAGVSALLLLLLNATSLYLGEESSVVAVNSESISCLGTACLNSRFNAALKRGLPTKRWHCIVQPRLLEHIRGQPAQCMTGNRSLGRGWQHIQVHAQVQGSGQSPGPRSSVALGVRACPQPHQGYRDP